MPEVDVGIEPPIRLAGAGSHALTSRSVSLRWLAAVVLTGVAGAGLIGATVLAVVDGRFDVTEPPELAGPARVARADQAGPVRGDRLVRSADVVAERQTFKAPVAVGVGDKQVIHVRGFTHVATTLALASSGGVEVPDFDPIRLMAQDENPAEAPPVDPGPALSDADVSFTMRDLATASPTATGGSLSTEEIQAQVAAYDRMGVEPNRTRLSGQALLARTSLAGAAPAGRSDSVVSTPPPSSFASIEIHMVAENVTVVPRSDAGREREGPERLVVFRRGDDLESVLAANGATRDQARAIVGAFAPRRGDPPVAEGRRLRLMFTRPDEGRPKQIARVSVYADETLEATVALTDAGGYVRVASAEAPRRPAAVPSPDEGGFRLYESLYETALRQSVPKPLIEEMVRIFGNDVDFQRSVAGGDAFEAFYADEDGSGGHPELLFASITVRGETFRYYRYVTPDDNAAGFYDENGRSVRKFLIRNPVPNGIFTSAFGMRFHPVLGYSRPHTGVDWTAPIGTPILASGSGTVLKAERSSSYGNHVEIQHANDYVTTYSHMTGFARGIVAGARVRQGQVVGYLGQTGLATGPHLHYEVIVNGHFVDPMKVKLARTREMDGRQLADFKRERDRIDGLMASAPNAVASAAGRHAAN